MTTRFVHVTAVAAVLAHIAACESKPTAEQPTPEQPVAEKPAPEEKGQEAPAKPLWSFSIT